MPRTTPDQVLDATARCVARVGLAKTTLDDVAREAGCARATVYRYFGNKHQMLAALVVRDTQELGAVLTAHARTADSLRDAVVVVIVEGARALQSHPALTFIAAHEPQMLMPYLAFERESAVLIAASELLAPGFTPFLPAERAERLAEWIARIAMSFLCCPSDHFDVSDPAQVRALVDDFVLPGFLRPADALEGIVQ
jgi:AcrR family transcriptional regulator